MDKLLMATLILFFAWNPNTLRSETIILYTYHDKTPYVVTEPKSDKIIGGLYRSYVEYLNQLQQKVKVHLSLMPRKRLEGDLEKGKLQGAIIGVNPLWFKDKDQQKYLWSAPLMVDKDIVVLRDGLNLEYTRPDDLTGLNLALPRGLYYWGVTELADQGKIKLQETGSDVQDLKMLAKGRVDGTIMSYLTYQVVIKEVGEHRLQVMKTPHDRFERMILFPKPMEQPYQALKDFVKNSFQDPVWLNKLKEYGYEG